MAPMVDALTAISRRFKPHLLIALVQIGYTFLYLLTDISFNHGMNPHVFVTYRHALGALVMFPFAYFLERKVRPKLTLALFLEIFLLSLVGASLTLNMYFVSMEYTSPTFVTAMVNTVPSLTFIIAVTLRLEAVDVRNPRGIAKVLGTLISLAGAMTMTLYKGPAVESQKDSPINIIRSNSVHENWIKGPILTAASCVSWSIWYVLQAMTLKRYPAQLSLTVWINLIGGIQSAAFTVLMTHKQAAWSIAFNIDFWTIIYAGVICSGIAIFFQLWCTEQKGPVFVTAFYPLGTLLVALQAYFLLGEKLYMGRILGGIIVIIGLYLVLWGKEGDHCHIKSQEKSFSANEEPKETKIPIETSTEREVPEREV